MAQLDLVNLDAVKLWLGVDDTSQDKILCDQITRVSSMVYGWLDGPGFIKKTRNEFYNGKGQYRLTLRNYPVLSVSSLTINGRNVPANPTPPTGSGWLLEPWDGDAPAPLQAISVSGWNFPYGSQNINVQYVSGYVTTETLTVDSDSFKAYPEQPQGLLAMDEGAVLDDGTVLTAVKSNPTSGQYVPANLLGGVNETNYYQFANDIGGRNVTITYSFIPQAVGMVVRDLVAERIVYRSRIGLRSKSLGGQETMSYDINKVSDWAMQALQPYQNVVPL